MAQTTINYIILNHYVARNIVSFMAYRDLMYFRIFFFFYEVSNTV